MRILSPDEIREIDPDAQIVAYPRTDVAEHNPVTIVVDGPKDTWERRRDGGSILTSKIKPAPLHPIPLGLQPSPTEAPTIPSPVLDHRPQSSGGPDRSKALPELPRDEVFHPPPSPSAPSLNPEQMIRMFYALPLDQHTDATALEKALGIARSNRPLWE